jgi:hypothetical protein
MSRNTNALSRGASDAVRLQVDDESKNFAGLSVSAY